MQARETITIVAGEVFTIVAGETISGLGHMLAPLRHLLVTVQACSIIPGQVDTARIITSILPELFQAGRGPGVDEIIFPDAD